MTDISTSSSSNLGPSAGSGEAPRSSWVPHIPAPLQRLFDAVPLVTYPPNELPYRSPGTTDLPVLHVFISEQDAARGSPSYNPSCLKWQTFLRIAGVRFHVCPSTNHASPTGALPFLQPPIPSVSTSTSAAGHQRLEARNLLPVPSSRLEAYAAQHGALPPPSVTSEAATPQLQSQTRRRQAYQSLLDGPIRDAWLYSLYLSPQNEHVLRRWYIDPTSGSRAVQDTILAQLRRAVRAEIAKSSSSSSRGPTTTTTTPGSGGWSLSGNVGDALTWALGGKTAVIDPSTIYAEAAKAFEALETLLYREGQTRADAPPAEVGWFFGAPNPTPFDAAVFSYVYLILHGVDDHEQPSGPAKSAHKGQGRKPWADDALRQTLVGKCRRLVAHTQKVLDEYWADQMEHGWVKI